MEMTDILALMDRFDASTAALLELEEKGWKLKLEKAAPSTAAVAVPAAPITAPPATPELPAPDQAQYLKAPLVGTFYAAPSPDAPPFVSVGDRVKKGQIVCVLEAMKMMSEVPAPADCVIEALLVEDGDLVGFDAPMFRIREV